MCPSDKRFMLLFTFLKKNRKKKVMVFFSSCMSVKYHNELLNYIDLPVMAIHVSDTAYVVIHFTMLLIIANCDLLTVNLEIFAWG